MTELMAEREATLKRLRTLLVDMDAGIAAIERICGYVQKAAGQVEDPFAKTATSALYLDRFYTAVEDLFLRLAVEFSGGAPSGNEWHKRLLSQMEREIPDVRPRVILPETRRLLDEYRRFRHRVRHAYDEELEWDKMERLVAMLPSMKSALVRDIGGFKEFISTLLKGLQ